MGKHEASPGKKNPAGNGKKKHTVLWILLAVVLVLGCAAAWILLRTPDQNRVIGTKDPNQTQQQEQPNQTPDDPQNTDTPQDPDLVVNDPATQGKREMKKGYYTFLLVGTNDDYNTDTMMLCSVDTVNDKVNLVSVNRDTQIDTDSSNKKINGVYGRSGVEAMCQAVTDITGVPIHYYVVVNMESFEKLVDLIGGVEYNVPFDMYHPDRTHPNEAIDLKAGLQTLDGHKALQFVRFRSTSENDFGRVNRQKDFLIATLKQVMANFSLSQIQDYIGIFNENVKTNMTVQEMIWFYVNAISGLNFDQDVVSDTIPYASTGYYKKLAYVYLDPQTVVDYVNQYLNPYTTDLTTADVNIPHLVD